MYLVVVLVRELCAQGVDEETGERGRRSGVGYIEKGVR